MTLIKRWLRTALAVPGLIVGSVGVLLLAIALLYFLLVRDKRRAGIHAAILEAVGRCSADVSRETPREGDTI